jgi:replicative DNA helicase
MIQLNRLKLSKNGIIVFGSRPGMGLTKITLKIANDLAKSEKVLFISYQTYKKKLVNIITQQDESVSPLLTINTELKFFEYGLSKDIKKLIKNTSAQTIFIDDLDGMLGESFELSKEDKDNFLIELVSVAKETNACIILNYCLTRKLEYRIQNKKPILQDFIWSRNLIEITKQIYSIYRPEYYGITEILEYHPGDDCSTKGRVEISLLKDENNEGYEYVFYNRE